MIGLFQTVPDDNKRVLDLISYAHCKAISQNARCTGVVVPVKWSLVFQAEMDEVCIIQDNSIHQSRYHTGVENLKVYYGYVNHIVILFEPK